MSKHEDLCWYGALIIAAFGITLNIMFGHYILLGLTIPTAIYDIIKLIKTA